MAASASLNVAWTTSDASTSYCANELSRGEKCWDNLAAGESAGQEGLQSFGPGSKVDEFLDSLGVLGRKRVSKKYMNLILDILS